VAVATSLLGVTGVVGFLAQVTGLLPVVTWSSPTGSELDGFTPAVAAVLVTSVLAVAATTVLWPRDSGADEDGEAVEEEVEEDVEEATEVLAGARPPTPDPVSLPELADARAVPVLPSVPVTDLDLYRRR